MKRLLPSDTLNVSVIKIITSDIKQQIEAASKQAYDLLIYIVDTTVTVLGVQWNLFITDTLGPESQFVIQRFQLFRLFYMHSNISGPKEAVCYREVFAIRRVSYKRFPCI